MVNRKLNKIVQIEQLGIKFNERSYTDKN